ncbi:MAG: EexN family lipoprotein [Nitrosospira sp.]|nr:EexN family lipoprotein [Nitrosospira sp.]MDN5882168.1 EexN family lipoprotein [Nitrosospira sp.]MDN5935242.1 EexN family lipoprotein [Nitrosospira sp.]
MKNGTIAGWMVSSALVLALVGCEPTKLVEEVRSVDWYVSHDAERAEQIAQCKTNPALLDATPNCVNASRAEHEALAATKWAKESEGKGVRTTPPVTR